MANSASLPRTYEARAKERVILDGSYRKIGISAVAAAVRYQDAPVPKNPAYAPASPSHREESADETG